MTQTEFEILVKNAADIRSNAIIANTDHEKAGAAMINIFRTSEKSIKMFVNCFESGITEVDGYSEALLDALENRKVSVEILFRKKPENSAFFDELCKLQKEKFSKQLTMEILSPEASEAINSKHINKGNPFLFAVSDGRMYRFETNIDTHQAWFCFNDEVKTNKLSAVFDEAFNLSKN